MPETHDKEHFDVSDKAFTVIGDILKSIKGFNLDIYKDKCIRRRIAIRIRATHSHTAEEYGELLRQNMAELDQLLKVLTIHVSQFFRNPPTFEKLRSEIIPYLLELRDKDGRGRLMFWSVGCASGEEPYSLALILKEFFPKEVIKESIAILATDVSAQILEVAKAGIYGEERLMEVPESIRERWFHRQDGKYHLLPELKVMVDFQNEDLFDIDSFPQSDLIVCRNVLIYFERRHQEKILNGFADVMRKGGILVLGKSETLFGSIRSRFQTICPVERIYRVV
jgi:chemotaxis protein methyltransferase CheR